ncbi:mannose/fructose/sorbose PTS transporter subunit IIA [Enterococcus hirae]|jgi:PTS system mannose-specific IIB component|nr:mannose/fructose/sorbose PTS transporter subunit IIA [Enterococcaceae bacterium]MCI1919222.1 mannose/fructose/sorbose PTS transporter subunit IIA [Enterococcaceae bacterium]MDM8213845.1 mannose/fructose/sorbose PTS transporter subunit IIA [Enterococcus hirae]
MVGIILASHGDFAKGILQSGSMIFGEQENVQAVTLAAHEGPDDIKKKMEDAIATFKPDDPVLFLIDLWGGTPFNQASGLLNGHEDKWAIITGMNLPMLIEAYSSRFSMNSAQEIAAHIYETARDGVKIKPETLQPKEAAAPAAAAVPKGEIPPGTVLGDGKIKIVLARIDSRLLHGQVATAWTKSVNPTRIIVVSDAVAKDKLRKELITQAAPPGVKANVVPIKKIDEVAKDPRFGNTRALLLFENPEDVVRAVEGGLDLKEVNLGSMAHSVGKVAVNKVVSMGPEDVKAFETLKAKGIKFDVRKVPADSSGSLDDILNKAKRMLAEQQNEKE